MLKPKDKCIFGMLLALLMLTACAEQKENMAEESSIAEVIVQSEDSDVEELCEETKRETGMDDWIGCYVHSGHSPQDSYISMNLLIYSENEEYFGYLNMEGSGNRDETRAFSNLQGRILLDVQGNQDMIELYFLEHITESIELHELLGGYQNGDLMFSLKKGDGKVRTIWQELLLDEREDDLKRGFIQRDEIESMILIDEKDQEQFLQARAISEQDQPFYQYYNEDGVLQLDFYYDMSHRTGTGVFYDHFQGQTTMYCFGVEDWRMDVWEGNEPYAEIRDERDLQLEGYEEERVYNERGQVTYFCSYVLRVIDKRETSRGKLVEIESTYREDGTLEKQSGDYYVGFGYIHDSGTYYYDEQERLVYIDSYITHGYLEDYYIYEGDSKTPKYRLTLDHAGAQAWAIDFVKYEQ